MEKIVTSPCLYKSLNLHTHTYIHTYIYINIFMLKCLKSRDVGRFVGM